MLRTARPVFSRSFVITLICTWLATVTAAVAYRRIHLADAWLLTAALPACLLEAAFYLGATFGEVRDWFADAFEPKWQAACLWASALLPYCVFSLASGTLRPNALALLAGLTAVLALWYAVMPRRPVYDAAFLVIAAAPVVARVFKRIYLSPDPAIGMDFLGHLMWIRVGITALLAMRGWDPGEFSLWPRAREWRVGLLYYLLLLIPLCATALALGDVQWASAGRPPFTLAGAALGTFFGILWVVALSEELFFRGFVARALLKGGYGPAAAVVVSALLFGSVHLWFHQFPNWRRAVVAAVLGVGCGLAYLQSRSVRAPMVTHALVVTTWRLFFR